jgi:hypothetical protein
MRRNVLPLAQYLNDLFERRLIGWVCRKRVRGERGGTMYPPRLHPNEPVLPVAKNDQELERIQRRELLLLAGVVGKVGEDVFAYVLLEIHLAQST